jgi:hypothetical protein
MYVFTYSAGLAVPEADRQCFPFLESLRSELIKDEE